MEVVFKQRPNIYLSPSTRRFSMSKAAELANLIGNINAGGGGVNRNVIINGAMNVAQRGTSFTVTNEFGLDRWFCRENTDGALTFSQDSTSPDGFLNL